MDIKEHIEHLASIIQNEFNESETIDEDLSYTHEDEDEDCIIGTFLVSAKVSEGQQIGKLHTPHEYTVIVRSRERMIPHFHVYDKEGRDRKLRSKKRKGVHTCVRIKENRYFKHGAYIDGLESEARDALEKFMNQVRTDKDYETGLGKTNYLHTIDIWNEQNHTKGTGAYVDKNLVRQPNYTTIND